MRQLSLKLLALQDEEHRSIPRELHDSVDQHLISAKMTIDLLRQAELPVPGVPVLGRLHEGNPYNLDLLHPPLIDELRFGSAARW